MIQIGLCVLLMLNVLQVYAWQKCVVDGRIVYRNGLCPSGAVKPIAKETASQPAAAPQKIPVVAVDTQPKSTEPVPLADEKIDAPPSPENKVWSNKNLINWDSASVSKTASSQDAVKKFIGSALLLTGSIINLIGFVFWLIVTFRVGLLWGIGCLIVPFLCLLFAVLNWNDSKKPAIYTFVGSILCLMGASLVDVPRLLGL